ncbi:NfeD family protein [Solirubrobacter sp. CPCC 204708]|uniref:NfeD family protein n=1 Tax=Solirubrobacter deserti TaxID=2282478 RepID=A0ABT4RKJ4_9ACTN|nr:NfeD family protein [Solirubrobacter deserti]MBE2317343.1 NfeD family protein [Solirubrobacter deserti]MDA0139072.1 NfeD family protein [Solirubrobacter deserti]
MLTLGLLLVLAGAALAAAEAHVPSHGALGASAVLALATGVALLLSAAGSATLVAASAGLGVGLAGAVALALIVRKALATRRMRASNSLIGRVGVARGTDAVFVDGGLWRARGWGLDGDPPLARGLPVVVENVNGLTLIVRPAEEWEVAP